MRRPSADCSGGHVSRSAAPGLRRSASRDPGDDVLAESRAPGRASPPRGGRSPWLPQCVGLADRLNPGDVMAVTLCAQEHPDRRLYCPRGSGRGQEPLAVHVVEGMRRYFGPRHPFTMKAINRLIRVAHRLEGRQRDQAAPLLAESLATAPEGRRTGNRPRRSPPSCICSGEVWSGRRSTPKRSGRLRECLQGLVQDRSGHLTRGGSPVFVPGPPGRELTRPAEVHAEAGASLARRGYEGLLKAPDAGEIPKSSRPGSDSGSWPSSVRGAALRRLGPAGEGGRVAE